MRVLHRRVWSRLLGARPGVDLLSQMAAVCYLRDCRAVSQRGRTVVTGCRLLPST